MTLRLRVVGRGRLGSALAAALRSVDGWEVDLVAGRSVAADATAGIDLVLLCVPDAAIADVARRLTPDAGAVVAHCSGAAGLDVLAPHERRASVHPLVSVPDEARGAALLVGGWYAVSGDPLVGELVAALHGRPVEVADADRARYHAAAVVASNHLVALMGQVERIAGSIGLPLDAFLDLARGSLDNVADLGAAAALTGPVARGDWDTVRGHLAAIDPSERAAYLAGVALAARLAGHDEVPLP